MLWTSPEGDWSCLSFPPALRGSFSPRDLPKHTPTVCLKRRTRTGQRAKGSTSMRGSLEPENAPGLVPLTPKFCETHPRFCQLWLVFGAADPPLQHLAFPSKLQIGAFAQGRAAQWQGAMRGTLNHPRRRDLP